MARGLRTRSATTVPAPQGGGSATEQARRLDAFMAWGARFVEWQDFAANGRQEAELNASWPAAARVALASGGAPPTEWREWMAEVYAAMRRRKAPPADFAQLICAAVQEHSELHFGAKRQFIAWLSEDPAATERRMSALWGPEDLGTRVRGFLAELPKEVASGLGARLGLVSLLLSGEDPEAYPYFQTTLAKTGYRLTGYPPPPGGADEVTHYAHYARFLRHLRAEAAARRLPIADNLDAYALLNWVGRGPTWFKKGWGPPGWDPSDVDAFCAYVADTEAA